MGNWQGDECRLCPSDILKKSLKARYSLFTRAFGLDQGVSSRDPHRIRETTSVGKPDGAGRGAFEHEHGAETNQGKLEAILKLLKRRPLLLKVECPIGPGD